MLSLCMCKEAGGGGGGEVARDTESKTRTPHKVVGKKSKYFRLNRAESLASIHDIHGIYRQGAELGVAPFRLCHGSHELPSGCHVPRGRRL